MNKKAALSLSFGIVISIVALYFSFRNIPIKELITYIKSINYFWMIPSVAAALFTFVLRTLRWQIILESSAKISFMAAYHPLIIGFMINCVLPGRIGEVARPAILRKKEGIPFSTGIATVAAERVFDIGLILLLFIWVLSYVDIDPNLDMVFGNYHLNKSTLIVISTGMLRLSIIIAIGILMISMNKTRNWILQLISGIPSIFFFAGPSAKKMVFDRISTPLLQIIENFAGGFSLVRSPKKLLACLGLSVLIWVFTVFSYQIMILGCPGIELSYGEIIAVMVIVCFFIALPSVPGWWGIWEAGGIFALSLFGIPSKDGAAFTLVNHTIQVIPVIIIGLLSAMITSINIVQISHENE